MHRFTYLRPSIPIVLAFDGAKIEIFDTPAALHDLGEKMVRITDAPRCLVLFAHNPGDVVSDCFERTEQLSQIDKAAADRLRFCAGLAEKRLAVSSVRIVSERVAVDFVPAELTPAEPQTAQIEFLRPSKPVRFTVDFVRVEITDTPAKHYKDGAKLLKLTAGHDSWRFIIDDPRRFTFGRFDRSQDGANIPPETADRVAYVAELARRRMIQMGFLRVFAAVPVRYAFTVSG